MGGLHATQIYYNKPVSKFLKIMQFKSENEETLIDYYETKDVHNEIHDKVRLRVITFLGKTIEKKPINVYDMAEEIDILLEKNYAVTINTKRPAQFVPQWSLKEVAQSRTSF